MAELPAPDPLDVAAKHLETATGLIVAEKTKAGSAVDQFDRWAYCSDALHGLRDALSALECERKERNA